MAGIERRLIGRGAAYWVVEEAEINPIGVGQRLTVRGVGRLVQVGDALCSRTPPIVLTPVTAGSSSVRKKFGELLRWFHDSESLPGTVVQTA